MGFRTRLLFYCTAFLSGLIGMSLEILGSRIFSPHFGLSTGIWTVLIGTVLLFMSVGYAFGGRLADRKHPFSTVGLLLLGAALTLSLATASKFALLKFLSTSIEPFYLAAFLGCAGTIGIPSFFLAALFPVLFQTYYDKTNKSGDAAARIITCSAIGSLFGTFFTGFILLEYFGHAAIARIYVVVLLALSILFFAMEQRKTNQILLKLGIGVLAILGLFFDSFPSSGIKDIDTQFSRYWIFDQIDPNSALHRIISSGRGSYQGEVIFEENNILYSPYLDFFALAFHQKRPLKKALLLGGGVFLFPQIFSKAHPDADLDIVEIDFGLTDIARRYFKYVPHSHHKIINQDARVFINTNTKVLSYDVIFIDIFKGLQIPFYMLSLEAIKNLKDALTDEGFILLNLLQGGKENQFLASVIKSYKVFFPFVYIFKHPSKDSDVSQNWTLLASQFPWDLNPENNELFRFQDQSIFETPDTLVFSDDFTPLSLAP